MNLPRSFLTWTKLPNEDVYGASSQITHYYLKKTGNTEKYKVFRIYPPPEVPISPQSCPIEEAKKIAEEDFNASGIF